MSIDNPMRAITVWSFKQNEEDDFKHHHIEMDWVKGNYPNPIKPDFENQRGWKGGFWEKKIMALDKNNEVVSAAYAFWIE